MASSRWKELDKYSACDLADALLKLNIPGAGFLPDISPIPPLSSSPPSNSPKQSKILAPASTFLMVPKATSSFPNLPLSSETLPPSNLTDSTPYSDFTKSETIVLISQPAYQSCAVVGGIHGLRMEKLGAKAIVVDGRVRDLATLGELGIAVWSKGTSIVGAGGETKFHARQVGIQIGAVTVEPGDIVLVDFEERGVVVVPQGKVDEVLGLLPRLVAADQKVEDEVKRGESVKDAFARHR